jgi:hypothetical protein
MTNPEYQEFFNRLMDRIDDSPELESFLNFLKRELLEMEGETVIDDILRRYMTTTYSSK